MEKHDKTLIASEKEMVEKQKKQEILYEFENIETRFGRNVRRLRRQQHLTQEDLADLCGFQQHYISDVELGKRNVSLRVVELLAKALRVDERELFLWVI